MQRNEMWIKIVPNDNLFFRTGRPFGMGSETWTDSIFPPYPSTIYGALRTYLLFNRGSLKKFKEEGYEDIGSSKNKGNMKIIGPLLALREAILFPAPLDLVKKKENEKLVLLSKISRPKIFFSDYPHDNLLMFKGDNQVEEANVFIDDLTLKDYLEGKKKEFFYIKKSKLYLIEPKIGIARERLTLTSKEGHLYRIPMIRLSRESFILVRVSKVLNMPEKGVFNLGGEGKTVYYEKLEGNPLEIFVNGTLNLTNRVFKIYLATPAIFEKGWLPNWIDENSLEGNFNGIELKLICCAIGKYVRIGGWDLAKKEPKPMYKAVPAGSVYYFEVLDNTTEEEIRNTFHLKNISDINPEEGFGLSLVGDVP
ncbi:MAG: type III-B CRISPR module-associated protein Cmr3 [Caldimicrobium sp.]|nr:type III-B CRISPR module-associated protein Cmr3 [Caldimicrobium sp.]MCX7845832.1 type III-B CRISPR module-associated protein Cmr3 [Dictyoglomaceae bacterium]